MPRHTPPPQTETERLRTEVGILAGMLYRRRQPAPQPTDGPHIHDQVAEDLAVRKAKGVATYGVALQAHNGRDALWDLYEELLDACCYLRQHINERDTTAPTGHPQDAPTPETGSGTAPPAP